MSGNISNKEVVRRLYEDCLNTRNFKLMGEFVDNDYEGFAGDKGPSGFEATVKAVIQGFPDMQWKVEDLIEEGDKVVIRWSWQGTNTGPLRGFPASLKHVSDHGMVIYQFRNHKIVKAWMESDRLGVLQQIDVIPKDLVKVPQPQN